MKLYVVRDKYGELQWFEDKPVWDERYKVWRGCEIGNILFHNESYFDRVEYGNEPYELRLEFV